MPGCPHPPDFIKAIKNEDGSIDYECDICGDVIAHDHPNWVDEALENAGKQIHPVDAGTREARTA